MSGGTLIIDGYPPLGFYSCKSRVSVDPGEGGRCLRPIESWLEFNFDPGVITKDIRKKLKATNPIAENVMFDFSSGYKKSAEIVLSDGTVKFSGVWMSRLEGDYAKFYFDKVIPEVQQ